MDISSVNFLSCVFVIYTEILAYSTILNPFTNFNETWPTKMPI